MIPHLCADELGMIAGAIAAVGAFIKPVRQCAVCYAVYFYSRVRGK